ncbi:hypothetical protein CC1G_09760 [Coprinopsis cinerea okayama7|uniref:Uncharacterized protein n=1 Tax=Coprinopsis cinerea (strain Okayama-7 / 130 / ATCC MYA-4618 / FGSC 9003) TaxID=240176 RepID=A8PE22_COPC7|nr:hypothetical protein CC1G_09760 [Coprinopsis cinerea okayama7\|eukprot:XP_001840709.2 hypothetical protein CC1G_09760 [Coprinopsis cinerea okayama7\
MDVKFKLLAEVAKGSPRHIRRLSEYSTTFEDADVGLVEAVLPFVAGGPSKPLGHYREVFSTPVITDPQALAAINSLKFLSSFCLLADRPGVPFDMDRTSALLASHWSSIQRWVELFVVLDYNLTTWSDFIVRVSLAGSPLQERLMKDPPTVSLAIKIFVACPPRSMSKARALEHHWTVNFMMYSFFVQEDGAQTACEIMTSNINRSEDVILSVFRRLKYIKTTYPNDDECSGNAVHQIRYLYTVINNAFLNTRLLSSVHDSRIASCFRLGAVALWSILASEPPLPTETTIWLDLMQVLNITIAWTFHGEHCPIKSLTTLLGCKLLDLLLLALAHTPVNSLAHREGLAGLELLATCVVYRPIWSRINLPPLNPPLFQKLPLEAMLILQGLRLNLSNARSLWPSAVPMNYYCDFIEVVVAFGIAPRYAKKEIGSLVTSLNARFSNDKRSYMPMSIKFDLLAYLLQYAVSSNAQPTTVTHLAKLASPEHRVIIIDHRSSRSDVTLACLQDYVEHMSEYPSHIVPRLESLLHARFSLREVRLIHGIFNYGSRNAHVFLRTSWRTADRRQPLILLGVCFIHDVIDLGIAPPCTCA